MQVVLVGIEEGIMNIEKTKQFLISISRSKEEKGVVRSRNADRRDDVSL